MKRKYGEQGTRYREYSENVQRLYPFTQEEGIKEIRGQNHTWRQKLLKATKEPKGTLPVKD